MAETGSCVLAAGAAALASYGLGQVGVWLLRVPTRRVWENVALSAGVGSAAGCLSLSLLSAAGALSIAVIDLLTLGFAAVGVWGLAACWIRQRIAAQTGSPWTPPEKHWPATGRPVVTLGLIAAGAALVQALAPPLPGNALAAEILAASAHLQSNDAALPMASEFALSGPLVLGGPGACSVFRWLLTALAAAAAGLAVELPGRQALGDRRAARGIAAFLALASPLSCSADQTAAGVLVGAWLALAWFAWRRSLCEPASGRWRAIASVLGLTAVASMAVEMQRASPPASAPLGEMFQALGPLLASAAPLAVLVVGVSRSSAAIFGMTALALGSSSGVGPAAAGWAAPLLAAGAAQAVSAFDGFRQPIRRWATAALAAALAVQAALPLVSARGVWAVALGREERDHYLSQRIAEFRAVRLLDAMARRQSLVISDQSDLLYYEGPRPLTSPPATDWQPEELARPVYLLHVDPPLGPARVEQWLAARGLALENPSLTALLDYEYDEGDGAPRRYRLLRLAPEAARELAASSQRAVEKTAGRAADPQGDDKLR